MLPFLRQCFWKTAAFRSSNRMPPKTTALRFQCSKALWMIDIKKSNCISTMCQSSLSLCKYISVKFFLIWIIQYLFEYDFSATWPMWVGADTNKCNMLSFLRQCFWKTAAFRSSNRMPPKRQLCVFNARKRYEWSTSRDSNCTSTICQSSLSLCKHICKVSVKFFLISMTQYLFEDDFSATWPMWVGADTNKCNMLSLLRQCFWKTAAFRSSNRMPPKTTALRFQCSKALWMIDIKKSNCISTMCQSSLSL